MIGFFLTFLAPKIGQTGAKIVTYVVLPLIVVGLLYWFVSSRIDNYGDRREAEGVATERAAWKEAERLMLEEAAKSATRADDAAAKRLEVHKEQVDEDRKAVEAAVENGTSPLDALFGS